MSDQNNDSKKSNTSENQNSIDKQEIKDKHYFGGIRPLTALQIITLVINSNPLHGQGGPCY